MHCITVSKAMRCVVADDRQPVMVFKITFQLYNKRHHTPMLQFKADAQNIAAAQVVNIGNLTHEILKSFQLAQIRNAFGQVGNLTDERKAVLPDLFILRHDHDLIKEGGDGGDEILDSGEEVVNAVEG